MIALFLPQKKQIPSCIIPTSPFHIFDYAIFNAVNKVGHRTVIMNKGTWKLLQRPKTLLSFFSTKHSATAEYLFLSYGITVIQWITSCHKNHMTTPVITLWSVHITSLTTSVSTMSFLIEIMFTLKAIKSHFKGSYDKLNLTLMVISYEIYETRQRLVS